MQIRPIQQNNTNFKAIEFSTVKARQKFMSALKKQSIVDFNETMNIIKGQHDNYEHIYIKAKQKGNTDKLNLYAVIRDEVVDTGNSLLEFLKTCAKKADSYKIESYQERIKEGSMSERAVKSLIYHRATREFKHTALPFDLSGV